MKKFLLPFSFLLFGLFTCQLQDTKVADNCFKNADYTCAEKAYLDLANKEKIAKLKAKYLNQLGTSQRRLGKTNEAFKSYEKAIVFDAGVVTSYINLSALHLARGSKEKALTYIQKGLDIDPQNQELYATRADFYETTKQNELAEKDHLYLISVAPDDFILKANYAHFKKNTGRYEEALKDYNRLLLEKPESLLYKSRGEAYYGLKKYKEASADVDKALKIDPKYSAPYVLRAKILFENKNSKEACASLNKAISLGYEKYLLEELMKKCEK